ncbi:hypothetical protein ABZ894_15055 [Nocardia beijingensis]|uniref:hypothetical protein n=1 Tax=Nocardia beijingensis TaxID=95162 RepID=UPI0033D702C4
MSTPGTTFLADPAQAAELARAVNDYTAALAHAEPGRFGFFATLPMPDTAAAAVEGRRAPRRPARRRRRAARQRGGDLSGEEGQEELSAC